MGPPAGALRATSTISQRVRRLGAALLLLLMAAAVGGCGGSEEPGGAGGTPATTAAPPSIAAGPATSEPVVLAAQSTGSSTKDVSVTLDELAGYFPNSGTAPFWITVAPGQVTKIAQQFPP
jgi:hypothetical protein